MAHFFQATRTHRPSGSAQGLQQAHQPLQKKLSSLTTVDSFKTSLYKIPSYKVNKMKEELTPTVIGLGGFHGKLDSEFQVTKLHYFNEFLNRDNKPIEIYWKKLEEMESLITNFYFPQPTVPKEELLETMLVDGGFLLELFIKHKKYSKQGENYEKEVYKYIPKHVMRTLKRDLIKYENQIPFAVVQLLWGIQKGQEPTSTEKLHKICMKFFEIEVPILRQIDMARQTPKHLLEIYYSIHIFQHPPKAYAPDAVVTINPNLQVPNTKTFTSVPTASNLKEYGVKFNTSSSENNEIWVKFSDKTLELPFFKIDGMNRCILANFVTYEQVYGGRKQVSALCSFLNSLMRDDKDVNVLTKKGIIENILGNDKDLADFFSHTMIDVEVEAESNYLSGVIECINDTLHSQLKRWWGTFMVEFFKQPWSCLIVTYGLIQVVINIMRFVWQVQDH